MSILPRSAAWRIAILTALAFAIATLAIGFAVHRAVHSAFQHELEGTVQQASDALVDDYRRQGMSGLVRAIKAREESPANRLGFAIFDDRRARIAGSLVAPMPAVGWNRIVFLDPEEGPDPALALTTDLGDGLRLAVAADLEPLEAIDQTILAVFLAGSLAVLALGALLAVVLARYLARRLGAIALGSRAFAAGDYSGRAEISANGDEFDELALAINGMLDRIAALLANLRQVTSDIAHDMRTPLTNLRGQLETLRSAPEAEREGRLERALAQCDDTLRLFGAMLRISELEAGHLRKQFRPVDLACLTGDVCEAHEGLEEAHVVLLASQNGPVMVSGDHDLIAQALVNLVENALHHTPAGTTITIGAGTAHDGPYVYVRDDGPGISEPDRDRALERFVRLDAARTTPGHGLGLSLVAAIAEAHGATTRLSDAEPGLEVRITFTKELAA